ncbi:MULTISPECIES: hypothetical protein [Enterobacter]|uniref:hypothetical protein n=1 Tax=Enterobacter TaxID=547 RepID=UPI001CBF3B6F|nr:MULTISPECIES: hypothetical protein [Enterobacter]UAN18611.1 hypothetical protein KGP20_23880 [Enterobacter asburiae]UAN24887.1 hypothetical protein KGP25_26050 [Enterobacter sp. JBIWA003]UAN24969.1 hypothetical protein KGP25_26465 [Enterobacter sp. JBIWA003]
MKNKRIAVSAIITGCLLFSGLTFGSFERPVQVDSGVPEKILAEPPAVPEQITTNVLLRQILAELIKANSLKEERRCSDGDRHYSPGYIISVDKKTLRCDTGSGYPEWVEGGKS